MDVQTLHAELLQTLQQEFNSTINTLLQTVTSLRVEVLSLRTSAPPKPTLPDPDKFDGKAYHFDTWLPSIKAKLRINGPAIGNTTAQFYYVYLNLESTVQAMVLPQLAHTEEDQQYSF
jgi:hypothetical protein